MIIDEVYNAEVKNIREQLRKGSALHFLPKRLRNRFFSEHIRDICGVQPMTTTRGTRYWMNYIIGKAVETYDGVAIVKRIECDRDKVFEAVKLPKEFT
jgi:hypothetical protein